MQQFLRKCRGKKFEHFLRFLTCGKHVFGLLHGFVANSCCRVTKVPDCRHRVQRAFCGIEPFYFGLDNLFRLVRGVPTRVEVLLYDIVKIVNRVQVNILEFLHFGVNIPGYRDINYQDRSRPPSA